MTVQSPARPNILERVVRFGGDRALCGIVTRPADNSNRPAIIIFNTGIIHRVGHHRMYTKLSRRLAERGYSVVRFDFAGIGDSPAQRDDRSPLEENCSGIREVIDWTEANLKCDRVVLVGLCSGADHSVVYSGDDARVSGVVLMDPSIPRTRWFHVLDKFRRLKQPVVWTNFLIGKGRFWKRVRHKVAKGDAPPPPVREQFSRQDMETPETVSYLQSAYQKMVNNGISILAIFSGGHSYQHNYRRQILDALPDVNFGDRLELHYFSDCDHTFTYEADRRRLFRMLNNWLDNL
ncbi:alpha/beta fold hydrolase [Ruegeria sp. 2012CJ41-6]|uniref:Alpha/beta fold hydrolase n=1 Tax=Ruegeria spongiae TaxID=2942209 RepID=A0ABT0Q5J4_9RHOB|nr:alpha/beta fold hydrolase [Ruegeria spongiae]MCL6285129.1 alpha/beta fold hydrolase [Ruegeria spongiae]